MREVLRPQEFMAPSGKGGGGSDQFQPHRLTKRQRRDVQRADQAARQDELDRKGQQRRALLKVVGIGGGLVVAGAGGLVVYNAMQETGLHKEEEFSGEMEETRAYLDKWSLDVSSDHAKLERQMPQLFKLTAAFFEKQMLELFPDKVSQYDKGRLSKALIAVNEKEFVQKAAECGDPVPAGAGAFTSPFADKLYFNARRIAAPVAVGSSESAIKLSFSVILHELLHFTSLYKQYSGVKQWGIEDEVIGQKGISALSSKQSVGIKDEKCVFSWRREIEETVVQHAANKLAAKVGVADTKAIHYNQWAQQYQSNVLNLFEDREAAFREFLGYHQQTEPDKFFSRIGQKINPNSSDPLSEGTRYMSRLIRN